MTLFPGVGEAIKNLLSHDEAFGLPQGTVRGIVFIVLTVTMAQLCLKGAPIPAELSNILAGIVGFYFGQKTGNGHGLPPPPAP
jgi:hypothetical protein